MRDNGPYLLEDTTITDILKTFEAYYQKNDFKNALKTLSDHPESLPSGLWHYNLSTVYAKLENWPLARFHLLVATKEGVSVPGISQNQTLIEEKLEVGKLEKSLSTSDYLYKAAKFITIGEITSFSLVFLLIGLLILKKKPSFKRFSILLILTLLPLSFSLVLKKYPEGIVLSTEKVLDGPSVIFGSVADIPAGIKVITTGDGDWREILWPSRFHGWIRTSALKELE